jgi:hypothetical protein
MSTIDPLYVIEDPKIHYRTATGWVDALSGAFKPVAFPTALTTGVYAADPTWTPTFEISNDNFTIIEPGAVVEDFRVTNGVVIIQAPHVTIRRAEIVNGTIVNEYGGIIYNGLTIEDVTMRCTPPGKWMQTIHNTAILTAGYTCRRVLIYDTNEGVHFGGSALPLADPSDPLGRTVRLYDCFTNIIGPVSAITGIYCMYDDQMVADDIFSGPHSVGDWVDWHGDTCQAEDDGHGGVPLKVRNCSFMSRDHQARPTDPHHDYGCGASAIWYTRPTQAAPPDVDGLMVSGAGYSIHNGCGGDWRNVYVEKDAYYYGPIETEPETWASVGIWDNICVATFNHTTGQPDTIFGRIPRGYPGYGPLDPP